MSEFDDRYHLIHGVLAGTVQQQLEEVGVVVEVEGQIELVLERHPDLVRLLLRDQFRLEQDLLLQRIVEGGRVAPERAQLVDGNVTLVFEVRVLRHFELAGFFVQIHEVVVTQFIDEPVDSGSGGGVHVKETRLWHAVERSVQVGRLD